MGRYDILEEKSGVAAIMQDHTQILQRLGTIVGINIAIEQLQGTEADYNANGDKYRLNVTTRALSALELQLSTITRELKQLATGPEAMRLIQDATAHNADLFYKLINMDYTDQTRVSKLMDKIKREQLKKAA